MIARPAFNSDSEKNPYTHSPIHLKNTSIKVLASARLFVNTQPCKTPSTPFLEDYNTFAPKSPTSPTAFFHHSRNIFEDVFPTSFITFLPSTLEFSTTSTSYCECRILENGDGIGRDTIITCLNDKFRPGSVVLFKTWINGVHSIPLSLSSHGDELNKSSNRRSSLGISIPNHQSELKELSESKEFVRLWTLLGMADRNVGIEYMVKLGLDSIDGNNLWLTDNLENWPPGLYDAVKDLNANDLNFVLYRCSEEELDTIGN